MATQTIPVREYPVVNLTQKVIQCPACKDAGVYVNNAGNEKNCSTCNGQGGASVIDLLGYISFLRQRAFGQAAPAKRR